MRYHFLLLVLTSSLHTKDEIKSIPKGNLSLPATQQPGPLFSFGQLIINKGDILLLPYIDSLLGKGQSFTEVVPSILYGIRDDLSVYIELPIVLNNSTNSPRTTRINSPFTSQKLSNVLVQVEYAFYNYFKPTYANQATIVGNVSFPIQSSKQKKQNFSSGTSFFLGVTASYLAIDWYGFISSGATFTTTQNQFKTGNQFLYQAGIGKNISYASNKWIFTGIVEFFGFYRQRNKINHCTDPNSGGNIIFVGPSVWISTDRLIVQAGAAFPIVQHVNGLQNKDNYFLSILFGWKI